MKRAHFDCIAGISGDMVLGAFIDLGLPVRRLREEVRKLPFDGFTLSVKSESRHAIAGKKVTVKVSGKQPPRSFLSIKGLIMKSGLTGGVRERSCAVFENLARAEARVHGCAVDDVHFHEVGAVDSIVDIVGAAIGMELLQIDCVTASSVPVGAGLVETRHGTMPVPAPATLELLSGMPVTPGVVAREVTTPTGAAFLKTVAEEFGPLPEMVVESTGYGIGTHDFEEIPNLLRVIIGRSIEPTGDMVVLETTIDDMNPQIYGYLVDKILKEGARDVFLTPIIMKKGRPATLLTLFCGREEKERFSALLFRETTTLGVRSYGVERVCLDRREESVATRYGTVPVKVAEREGVLLSAQPEYEVCRRIAESRKVPLKQVMEEAKAAYRLKKK